MDSELMNIIKVCSSVISSICFCYFVSSKIPKGIYRLLSLLPIIYNFTIIPHYLSSSLAIAHVTFYITWLANFKLFLFSFNMGPLSMDPPKSLPLFITIASLPISITRCKIIHKPKKLPLNLPIEIFALSVLFSTIGDYKDVINPVIMLLLYSATVFLKIDVTMGIWAKTVRSASGLEMLPPSDEPYLATSLQDFWGKRWNLAVTRILRDTVHNPVYLAATAVLGDEAAKAASVLLTFLVSGLMHEVLLYNMTRQSPTWEMICYFVLQGVCLIVELRVKRAVGDRWRLYGIVSAPLSVGFVVVSGYWLFFPALIRKRIDVIVCQDFRDLVGFLSKPIVYFVEFIREM